MALLPISPSAAVCFAIEEGDIVHHYEMGSSEVVSAWPDQPMVLVSEAGSTFLAFPVECSLTHKRLTSLDPRDLPTAIVESDRTERYITREDFSASVLDKTATLVRHVPFPAPIPFAEPVARSSHSSSLTVTMRTIANGQSEEPTRNMRPAARNPTFVIMAVAYIALAGLTGILSGYLAYRAQQVEPAMCQVRRP